MAFDAVIPANVRYSSSCCMGAKMLYGEIRSLTYSEGFCWASDEYFATLYAVTDRTIRTWLKELTDAGFVEVESSKNQHGKRKIALSESAWKKTSKLGRKLPSTLEENFQAEGGVYKDEELCIVNTPIIPTNENKKVTRNAKSQSTVTEHFGDNPICPAEYANDASRNHGFSQERIDAAFGAFYDHHASKGTKFADHRAAFRTWCRNEVKFATRGSSPTGGGVRDKAAAAVSAVVAMRYGVPSESQGISGWQNGDAQAETRDEVLPW